eukprot:6430244-Prymnesium_polylepis.1
MPSSIGGRSQDSAVEAGGEQRGPRRGHPAGSRLGICLESPGEEEKPPTARSPYRARAPLWFDRCARAHVLRQRVGRRRAVQADCVRLRVDEGGELGGEGALGRLARQLHLDRVARHRHVRRDRPL